MWVVPTVGVPRHISPKTNRLTQTPMSKSPMCQDEYACAEGLAAIFIEACRILVYQSAFA